MSDKTYIGRNAKNLQNAQPLSPFSMVRLWADGEHCYEAGDDSGRVLEAKCPWATQAMADYVLGKVKGYSYRPFIAKTALLDPAAEIGDGVSVGGTYTVLGKIVKSHNPMCTADISAPFDEETYHELPYRSSAQREVDRKLAQAKAEITVTTNQIKLLVQDANGKISTLTQTVDGFEQLVKDATGAASSINQKLDSISLEVQNGTKSSWITLKVGETEVASERIRFTGDVVFESDLEDGSTSINGGCIKTGYITAERIILGGQMELWEDTDQETLGGYFGFMHGRASDWEVTDGVGIKNRDQTGGMLCSNRGSTLTFDGNAFTVTASGCHLTGPKIWCNGTLYAKDGSVITSDRNAKKHISYSRIKKLLPLFDALDAAVYRLKGGKRRHAGFIAQDVVAGLEMIGVPLEDAGLVCVDENGKHGLRYEEFIPLLWAKVQQQQIEIDELRKAVKPNG